jgi:hypothetical protein
MSVFFANNGTIDLDALSTLGVNVKEDDNPIGQFGTGFKYAMAVLLRTGHRITIFRKNEPIIFVNARTHVIRGKEFNIVYFNDTKLGFTTDLGKHWEVWMAYRELYSNAMDENGKVITFMPEDQDIIIKVDGEEIEKTHGERSTIFLMDEPWKVTDGLEIHRRPSQYLYYRGIRVFTLETKSMFTYNFTSPMVLTEDRTIASQYDAQYRLGTKIPTVDDFDLAVGVIKSQGYERNLNFIDCWEPSESFLHAIQSNLGELDNKMVDYMKKKTGKDISASFELDEVQLKTLEEAKVLLEKLNCNIDFSIVKYVEDLGAAVYARVLKGEIYIARQTISNGSDFLAITLYEEFLHTKNGLSDLTRAMQQFLFDKILELVKKI